MWKWIGGCLLVVVALIVGASWWGYQAMQKELAPDGSTTVTIAASPARIFASLADNDSALTWMGRGNRLRTSRRGPLLPGDTLTVEMRPTIGMPQQSMTWTVTEVVPNRLLALEVRVGTDNRIVVLRRDSLVAEGDSTRVVSILISPMLDSASTQGPESKAASREGVAGLTGSLMLSMFRVQAKLDLQQLKARLEGKPSAR